MYPRPKAESASSTLGLVVSLAVAIIFGAAGIVALYFVYTPTYIENLTVFELGAFICLSIAMVGVYAYSNLRNPK